MVNLSLKKYKNDIKTIIELLSFIALLAMFTLSDNTIAGVICTCFWIPVWSFLIYDKLKYKRNGYPDEIRFPTQNDTYFKMTAITLGSFLLIGSVIYLFVVNKITIEPFAGVIAGALILINGILFLPRCKLEIKNSKIYLNGINQEIESSKIQSLNINNGQLIINEGFDNPLIINNLKLDSVWISKIKGFINLRLVKPSIATEANKPKISPPENKPPIFANYSQINEIWNIFPYVLKQDIEIAKKAASTINRIIRSKTGFKNIDLYNSFKYIELKQNQLDLFCRFNTEEVESLVCIATLNRNGFIRESALAILEQKPSDFSFPFILFRLADWVKQVSQTAIRIINKQLSISSFDMLVKHYKLIEWLIKVQRSDLSETYQQIKVHLFSPENSEYFIKNIEKYNEGERYYLYSNLIENNSLNQLGKQKIVQDKSFTIRMLAIRKYDFTKEPEIFAHFLNDKNQKIRLRTLSQLQESKALSFKTEIEPLIFDSSAAVRSRSRHLVSLWSKSNFNKLYSNKLALDPTPGALLGLAECGSSKDIEQIQEFISSTSSKMRATAIFALNKIDSDIAINVALTGFSDSSNKVKKTSFKVIAQQKEREILLKLRTLFEIGDSSTKRYVLKTINEFGGWEIAGDLLKGIMETDKSVRTTAIALFDGWYRYSSSLGTKKKLTETDYVMNIFNTFKTEADIPTDITEKIEMIPFIFKVENNS